MIVSAKVMRRKGKKETMIRIIFAGLAAIMGMTLYASAEGGADRAVVFERILEGLNSPDPVVRLTTLEDVFASGDQSVKRLASQTALASSDYSLRSAALEQILADRSALVMKFSPTANSRREIAWEHTGGIIDLRLSQFDRSSGDFAVVSSHSAVDRASKRPVAGQGNLYGDRLSLLVDIKGSTANSVIDKCRAAGTLASSGSVISGEMICGNEQYTFEIDVLR